MGEMSKNIVAALAIAVIIVSAVGTMAVLDASTKLMSSGVIPTSMDKVDVDVGKVRVFVNGSETSGNELDPTSRMFTGMVSVRVAD